MTGTLALMALLLVCLPHSSDHRAMKHIAPMDTEEEMSMSTGLEQNPMTDESLPMLRKPTVADNGHHHDKKGLSRKQHFSHRRHHTAQGDLEDGNQGLDESAMRSKEPKECKCSLFPLRRRHHGKFSRKKSINRRCKQLCMKERRKPGCYREPCKMDIAMPLS